MDGSLMFKCKTLVAAVAVIGLGGAVAYAQSVSFQDVCAQYQHQTVTVPIATPTAKLVSGVAGQAIYVCAIHMSNAVAGATPAATFYSGTGSTCGTSNATLIAPAAGNLNIGTGTTTVALLPVAANLCVSDTTINKGNLSIEYVQK